MGAAGKWWAWKTDVAKRSCYTLLFIRLQSKKHVQAERGLIQRPQLSRKDWDAQDIVFTHRQAPWALDLLLGWKSRVTPLTLSTGWTVHCQAMTLICSCCSLLRELFNQIEFQVFHKGPNLVIQMYRFNPRLRHLVAVLIQHLYSRACSSVFQTLNFPWNRCENQRKHSDLVFCFTMKELSFSPPVILMLIFLPVHLDLTNSSHFSSWHNISLSDASDGNCTELPQSAGNQFFTPPNSSPKFRMRNKALALSYLMSYFFFLFLLYITFWQMQVELFQDK